MYYIQTEQYKITFSRKKVADLHHAKTSQMIVFSSYLPYYDNEVDIWEYRSHRSNTSTASQIDYLH